jgi:MHS family proline/betaine transporter-like MFS transporter
MDSNPLARARGLTVVNALYAWVIARPSLQSLLIVQAIMAVPMGVISGLIPSLVAHGFPTEIRSTGLALSYNIPTTLFGGFSPLIITYLIASTQNKAAPALYIIGAGVLSLVSLAGFRRNDQARSM